MSRIVVAESRIRREAQLDPANMHSLAARSSITRCALHPPATRTRPARRSPPRFQFERATYGLCAFSLVGFGRTRPARLLLTSDRAGYRELRVETGERYDTRAHRVAAQERSVGTFSTTGRLDRPSVKLGLASDPPTSMHASPAMWSRAGRVRHLNCAPFHWSAAVRTARRSGAFPSGGPSISSATSSSVWRIFPGIPGSNCDAVLRWMCRAAPAARHGKWVFVSCARHGDDRSPRPFFLCPGRGFERAAIRLSPACGS